MPTEHTLLLALFGLLALTVGLLALLIYLVLSDRHRRGAEGDDLCDALLEGVAGAKREIEGTVAKTDARAVEFDYLLNDRTETVVRVR